MPRLPPSLLRHAHSHSSNLALLLLACRDLPSARNELRWITEHVVSSTTTTTTATINPTTRISNLVQLRARGVPLQYLLSTQPFGELDILCRRGVLIPRPETEAYTHHLATLIRTTTTTTRLSPSTCSGSKVQKPLAILDICSGTGCIALGLFSLLRRHFPALHVRGIDVSRTAIALARKNIIHNNTQLISSSPSSQNISFQRANIFDPAFIDQIKDQQWDVIISNPPYVDPGTWSFGRGSLGLSVRRFEPELALVAPADAPLGTDGIGWERRDAFYGRLAEVVKTVEPEMALWEVGDEEQAARVLKITRDVGLQRWESEVWRDWPDMSDDVDVQRSFGVRTRGSGNVRSIFLRREVNGEIQAV